MMIIARIWAIVNIEATPYDQLYIFSVVIVLICFDRLWETLKEKNISYGIITNGKEKTQMNKINSLFPIIAFPIIISLFYIVAW